MKTLFTFLLTAALATATFGNVLYRENFSMLAQYEGDGIGQDGFSRAEEDFQGWRGSQYDLTAAHSDAWAVSPGSVDPDNQINLTTTGVNNNDLTPGFAPVPGRGYIESTRTGGQDEQFAVTTEFQPALSDVTSMSFDMIALLHPTVVRLLVQLDGGNWYLSSQFAENDVSKVNLGSTSSGDYLPANWENFSFDINQGFYPIDTIFNATGAAAPLSGSTITSFGIWISDENKDPGGVTGYDAFSGRVAFDDFTVQGIPEPSALALLGLGGLAGALLLRRRG